MPNRLATESSPYLRQHGDDPVDWFPWGEEAFARARETGRPIFLSIGYASCHWCHVMHRESFSDAETARRLNDSFVSIKVDRESRPDVDEHYMAYVVASTGHGGWPMSVFLTPALVPVFGGTYYPPEPHPGIPSFTEVLESLASAFAERPDDVGAGATEALEHLSAVFAPARAHEFDLGLIGRSARDMISHADPRHGGFGRAPKFPQAPVTDFLLAYHRATGDAKACSAVEAAVEGMVRGGIYDQAGGGICRYSTDERWLVPHFEKMLYDNGQLLSTLAKLHQVAPRKEWAHVMQQTAEFLERELAIDGLYASSLDADTLGIEGATYVWTYEDLADALAPNELALAEDRLGVTPSGNWEGANILTRSGGHLEDDAAVEQLLTTLLQLRQVRAQPGRDDKVIVSWNAFAAIGLIDAADALNDTHLADRGLALVRRLLDRAVDAESGVRRIVGDPASADVCVLEDATALVAATIRAAEATGESALWERARRLFDHAEASFHDGDGTWYLTGERTDLPIRPRQQHDSPLPSGPSLAAHCAIRLAGGTGDDSYRSLARTTLGRMTSLADRSPFAAAAALQGMLALTAAAAPVNA